MKMLIISLKCVFILISFFHVNITAQIHSETAYYFQPDIDTLLSQLRENQFRYFDIEIRVKRAKTERFSYERINDSILKVITSEYAQFYFFDTKSKCYQPLDSLLCPYSFPNLYSVRKDSAGFMIAYLYEVDRDTTLIQYTRNKLDTKGRFVYGYNYSPQNKSGQVIECTYTNDSVVITKNSIFDSWHKQLLSCDTTLTSIYVKYNMKTIKQYCKVQNCALNRESHCFYITAFSEKVIMFNKNRRIDKITYAIKSSGSRKEKSSMKVIYTVPVSMKKYQLQPKRNYNNSRNYIQHI